MNRFFMFAALLILAGSSANAQDRMQAHDVTQTVSATILESKKEVTKPDIGTDLSAVRKRPPVAGEKYLLPTKPLAPLPNERSALPNRDSRPQRDDRDIAPPRRSGFQWSAAIKQSLLFLGVQQGFAVMTQAKTRRALRGPFFKDYFRSVRALHGWNDGGRFFTNYVAHTMEGSFLGFIQVQNDPRGREQTFGRSGSYWRSRLKAFAWSAAWSTQFEIGPISQASIGNVGLSGKQTYIDIVVTPTFGLGLLVTEDALDRYIVKKIETRTSNFYIKIFTRMLLNPTRTVANVLRLKTPWFRDRGLR